MNDYSLFVLIVFLSTLPTILKKRMLDDLTNTEFYIIFLFISSTLTLINWFYKSFVKKEKISALPKIKKNPNLLLFMFIIVGLKFFTSNKKAVYLKNNELSKFTPMLKSLIVIFTFLSGIIIFKEKRVISDWLGLGLIVSGMYLMNR